MEMIVLDTKNGALLVLDMGMVKSLLQK